MKRTFIILSVLILVFFVWQIQKEYNTPYLSYQRDFLDLLAQKGGGEPEIKDFQLGVRQRWIEKLNRIDRCETCHLGIEDPRFEDAPQPFKTHPDPDVHIFERFGCTFCHSGQGQATSLKAAHGPTENWYKAIYHENFMQGSCRLCHGDFIQAEALVLSRGIEIFNEVGCTGCHELKGEESVKVGPPIKKIWQKVRPDWLYRWIKDPKQYLPLTKMPNFMFSDQEVADISLFLSPRNNSGDVIEDIGGSYASGKKLFGESRCVSCHSVDGRGGDMGPDHGKVSSKIYPSYIYKFIKDPQELLPDTEMPTFGFSVQEIKDLTSFLVEEYIDFELEEDKVEEAIKRVEAANILKGEELIKKYGCTGCHDIDRLEDPGKIGVELTNIGDIHISRLEFGEIDVAIKHRTVPNWFLNKMKNPRLFNKEHKMPDYQFIDLDADAVTTYLLSLTSGEVPSRFILPLGAPPSNYNPQGAFGKLLKKYRCLSCHKINGRGGDLAPDLSQEGSRIRKEWLQEKAGWLHKFMKTPYAIRPILVERMPRFKMQESEIDVLYFYLQTTLVDDRVEDLSKAVSEMQLDNPKSVQRGKKLFYEKYACIACHQINLKGGTIGPDLTGSGERLSTEWLIHHLRNPKAFAKRSVEPVFDLTDDEIEALTAFLVNVGPTTPN